MLLACIGFPPNVTACIYMTESNGITSASFQFSKTIELEVVASTKGIFGQCVCACVCVCVCTENYGYAGHVFVHASPYKILQHNTNLSPDFPDLLNM